MDQQPPPRPPSIPHDVAKAAQTVGGDEYSATELDSVRRLRVLEERFVNLRNKAQLADEKVLAAEARLRDEIKAMTAELVQLRSRVADAEDKLSAVTSELRHAASVHDVQVLEKYVAYWNPMDFVTKKELSAKQTFLKERQEKDAKAHGH